MADKSSVRSETLIAVELIDESKQHRTTRGRVHPAADSPAVRHCDTGAGKCAAAEHLTIAEVAND